MSMSELEQLVETQAATAARIATLRVTLREQAVADCQELIALHGLESRDLFQAPAGLRPLVRRKRAPMVVKFRDPASGKTWCGVGREPGWIAGRDRSAFAV
jgi:DNA-binding protein H-NS